MNDPIIEKDAFKVIGRFGSMDDNFWGQCKADPDFFPKLNAVEKDAYSLGLCFGNDENGKNKSFIGIESEHPDIPGFDSFSCPKSKWLMFIAEGKISENVLGNCWRYIYSTALAENALCQRALPTVETYVEWDEDKDFCTVEIAIPVE